MTHHDIRPRTSCTGQALVLARISTATCRWASLVAPCKNGNQRCSARRRPQRLRSGEALDIRIVRGRPRERSDNSVAMVEKQDPWKRHVVDSASGEVTLNYVSPGARFRGVSRALLTALENRAAERGNVRCTLTSTETARRFYQANGYVEDGRLDGKFGTSASYAMSKLLATKDS